MKIFPAVHYSMGGLWVDYDKDPKTGGLRIGSPRNQSTNIPGLYAIGETDYQYHGANRLGANSLLSCIFSGLMVAPSLESYLKNLPAQAAADANASLFERETARHRERYEQLIKADGHENPYNLHRDLGQLMTRNCTVVRYNKDLKETVAQLGVIADRYKHVALSDRTNWTNQTLSFAPSSTYRPRKVIATAPDADSPRAHYNPIQSAPHSTAPTTPSKHVQKYPPRQRGSNHHPIPPTPRKY